MRNNAAFIEEQIRHRRVAREEVRRMKSLLSEQGGSKVVSAFTDVFKALRLAAMDVSNSLRLVIGMVLTFDPQKMKKKMEKFDERRQKINAEWAPILDRAKESFKNADPILTMAIMGPSNFLALQGIGAGLVAGKTAAEVLTATNWDSLINSFTVTLDLNQSLQQFYQKYTRDREEDEREFSASSGSVSRGKRLLSRLSALFSEGKNEKNDVISEKVDPEDSGKIPEKVAIDAFVKATGMDAEFKKIREENLKNLKETIEGLISEIQPMVSSSNLFAAKSLKEMNQAFATAKSINPKIDQQAFEKFTSAVKEQSKKLVSDKQFAESLKKKLGKADLSPQEIASAAENNAFQVAKNEFDKTLASGLKSVVETTEGAIKSLRIDANVLENLKKSPYSDANEVATIYEKLLNVYTDIKRDFDTKAKSKVA